MLEIIAAQPNLTVHHLLERYKKRYGCRLVYRGKLKDWLLSIAGVRITEATPMRIRLEQRESSCSSMPDPPSPSPPEPPSTPDPPSTPEAKRRRLEFKDADTSSGELSEKKTFHLSWFKQILAKSNMAVSLSYFWEYFDQGRYSIWYCEYKNPEKLGATSDSVNLIYDMANRLGLFWRKAFASICLFEGGDDAASATISGVWVWRSPGMRLDKEVWRDERENFSWRKLDPVDSHTKTLVDEYFTRNGDFDGKKLFRGMLFQ